MSTSMWDSTTSERFQHVEHEVSSSNTTACACTEDHKVVSASCCHPLTPRPLSTSVSAPSLISICEEVECKPPSTSHMVQPDALVAPLFSSSIPCIHVVWFRQTWNYVGVYNAWYSSAEEFRIALIQTLWPNGNDTFITKRSDESSAADTAFWLNSNQPWHQNMPSHILKSASVRIQSGEWSLLESVRRVVEWEQLKQNSKPQSARLVEEWCYPIVVFSDGSCLYAGDVQITQ